MDLSVEGQRVLVTAGAQGIGRATIETFVRAGAKVHTCDVDEAALAALGRDLPQVTRTVADVASFADVERMFAEAKAALGGLDVLINNAGIAGPTARIEEMKREDWERTIAVNLHSMFYCTHLAVPLLKQSPEGVIINLSSVAGRLAFPMRTPYSATKWGVVGFTKSLAAELGEFGIRVNAIQPGAVEGDRIDRVISAKAAARGISIDEMCDITTRMASLRRFVSAQDIANMMLFLCSPLGRNVSGQAISVCADVQYLI